MGDPRGGKEEETETDTHPERWPERRILGLEGQRPIEARTGRAVPLPRKKPRVHRPALESTFKGLEEEKSDGTRGFARRLWLR